MSGVWRHRRASPQAAKEVGEPVPGASNVVRVDVECNNTGRPLVETCNLSPNRDVMKRHAYAALFALSVVLAVVVAVTWSRSYGQGPSTISSPWALISISGRVAVFRIVTRPTGGRESIRLNKIGDRFWATCDTHHADWHFAGFSGGPGLFPPSNNISRTPYLTIPYWFLFSICVLLSVILFRLWRVGRRGAGAGHCPECGYDLRAQPRRVPGVRNPHPGALSPREEPDGLVEASSVVRWLSVQCRYSGLDRFRPAAYR